MSKCADAIAEMNSLGAKRIPFLFVLDFDLSEPFVCPLADVCPENILFDISGISNFAAPADISPLSDFRKRLVPISVYGDAFRRVREHLFHGDTYLLNLTFSTPVDTSMTLRQIFHCSRARYRLFFFDRFTVFSPECFVKIGDNSISSYPMKGTIDASLPDAERQILEDGKELAEHTTVVDLIRNDLSMVASNVQLERFRYVERIKTHEKELLQVSSKIVGDLSSDFHGSIGTILYTLLPAGSVTGAPKKKTVEIIRSVESSPRGYFSGVFGYFDGSSLDSAVMIRYIERQEQGLVYRSGGGITVSSRMETEYQEMIDKIYVPATPL